MIPLVALLMAACVEPSGLRITAGDVSRVVPAFAALPAESSLGYSPRPGIIRRFTRAELSRLLPGAPEQLPESLCVEWPMSKPDADVFRSAMSATLPEGAQLTVLEMSQAPIPAGPVRFPISGLSHSIWRGHVEYAPGGRFDVWARVEVRVPYTRVVLVQDIAAGTVIDAGMLRTETVLNAPDATVYITRPDEAVGRPARRALRQGSAIPQTALDRRIDVRKGDALRVKIRSGAASIGLEGIALASAGTGETIPVQIGEHRQTVRARVAGPGEATVIVRGN